MDASPFDTLAAADKLRGGGFDDRQAHAIIEVHRLANEPLATKTDLDVTRTDLKADLKATRTDFKAELKTIGADFKADLEALEGRL